MDELICAVQTVSRLCAASFGPCGEETLLFAPPSPPLITSDSRSVLKAWQQSDDAKRNPFETLILKATDGLYREIGDGTAEFILLLRSMIEQFSRSRREHPMLVARSCASIRRKWDTQTLFSNTTNYLGVEMPISIKMSTGGLSETCLQMMVTIIISSLTGSLGSRVIQHLSHIVISWLFTTSFPPLDHPGAVIQIVFDRIERYLTHAPNSVIFAVGTRFETSGILGHGEFVLQKGLIPSQVPSILPHNRTTLSFICFTCSLTLSKGSTTIIIDTKSHEEALAAQASFQQFITQYLITLYNDYSVKLLITTEEIDASVGSLCTQLGIACVQYAEKEDVIALCSATAIIPLSTLFHPVHNGIGSVKEGSITLIRWQQGKQFLHLRGLQRAAASSVPAVIVPQLVVRAPTKGVYTQYYNAILKSLRVLRSLWRPSVLKKTPSLRVCRGAGATELELIKHLSREATQSSHVESDRFVLSMLSTALKEVVIQLRTNIVQVSGTKDEKCRDNTHLHSRRDLLRQFSQCHLNEASTSIKGYVLDMQHVITTSLGTIEVPMMQYDDPLSYGILHPYARIDTLLHVTLQTMEQVLRINTIVYTKRYPKTSHQLLDQDDDSSE